MRMASVPKSTPIGLGLGAKKVWTKPSIFFSPSPRAKNPRDAHGEHHTLSRTLTYDSVCGMANPANREGPANCTAPAGTPDISVMTDHPWRYRRGMRRG